MSFQDCLVAQRSDGWLVMVGDESQHLPGEVTAEELVTCVDVMTKHAGLKSPGCVLAPDSASCFFATLHVASEIDRSQLGPMVELRHGAVGSARQ